MFIINISLKNTFIIHLGEIILSKKPLLSVIMSLYNTPEYQLRKSIESILAQTYKNFEFIIINDGTKDEGVKVIESYKDERIKIIHNEKNIGLEKSLNKGINYANSDYIVRMDTDDISYPNRFEKQLTFLLTNPEYDIVASKADFFDDSGIFGSSNFSGEVKKNNLLFGNPFIHPSMIIRKKAIKEVGGYPLYRRCEDYALVLSMYSFNFKGFIIDESLLMYRMDSKSYEKRLFKHRITELRVRMKYFKKLNIRWYEYFYVFKPILSAIIPNKIISKYHRIKYQNK